MRLVTRGDLDGLTCAVLISLHERIDELLLTHPQRLTEGEVEIRDTDIIANLPYQAGCSMWFDHHLHTATVATPKQKVKGSFGQAPSAARLVYEFYGGDDRLGKFAELVHQTDRLDSADLTLDDILDPEDYIKLGFTIDGRSGLGAFSSYFKLLVRLLRQDTPIAEVLVEDAVAARCRRLEEEDVDLHKALENHSREDGNVLLTDFRTLGDIPAGNRFLVFAVFPKVNVAVRVQWGPNKEFAMLTLGHSIINRTCQTNVGELAARYGGGGHRGAGSIKLIEDPDYQIQLVLAELKANG
jgi:oligoribonuclease NrnB/cAMP/cGMP phosphodiesterase (DHH superfamily)